MVHQDARFHDETHISHEIHATPESAALQRDAARAVSAGVDGIIGIVGIGLSLVPDKQRQAPVTPGLTRQ
jgi:hypothetical protein